MTNVKVCGKKQNIEKYRYPIVETMRSHCKTRRKLENDSSSLLLQHQILLCTCRRLPRGRCGGMQRDQRLGVGEFTSLKRFYGDFKLSDNSPRGICLERLPDPAVKFFKFYNPPG